MAKLKSVTSVTPSEIEIKSKKILFFKWNRIFLNCQLPKSFTIYNATEVSFATETFSGPKCFLGTV